MLGLKECEIFAKAAWQYSQSEVAVAPLNLVVVWLPPNPSWYWYVDGLATELEA